MRTRWANSLRNWMNIIRVGQPLLQQRHMPRMSTIATISSVHLPWLTPSRKKKILNPTLNFSSFTKHQNIHGAVHLGVDWGFESVFDIFRPLSGIAETMPVQVTLYIFYLINSQFESTCLQSDDDYSNTDGKSPEPECVEDDTPTILVQMRHRRH